MKWTSLLLVFSIGIILYVFYQMVLPYRLEGLETADSLLGSLGNTQSSSLTTDTVQPPASSSPSTGTAESKVQSSDRAQKTSMEIMKMPLRQFVIMSSFNSAYDGKAVTVERLSETMARGYRFIDLNVFIGQNENKENVLYVGYSIDNAPTISSNTLTFAAALDLINKQAFVKTESSKSIAKARVPLTASTVNKMPSASLGETYIQYPLFLHIRVYRATNSDVDVVGEVVKAMEVHKPGTTWYLRNPDGTATSVNGQTTLESIQRNIVVSMDILNLIQVYAPSSDPVATNIPEPVRQSLRKVVNIFTGGHTWRAFYHYRDVTAQKAKRLEVVDDTRHTNVTNMFIVYPYKTDKSNPPSIKDWGRTYSIQAVPIRTYLEDEGVASTEAFFEDLGKPIAPMSACLLGREPDITPPQ